MDRHYPDMSINQDPKTPGLQGPHQSRDRHNLITKPRFGDHAHQEAQQLELRQLGKACVKPEDRKSTQRFSLSGCDGGDVPDDSSILFFSLVAFLKTVRRGTEETWDEAVPMR
ncbi:hypothetical protein EYF80_049552 [Liparis tanakae]|uniref:Uncharacterized protein n=1 Tax=Liparis tanakae TaxID=230148 RepID=A0A4Z2FH80_9TELE|nr:hypothetical protein EYF80_049552 [Liparis tanakae]